MLIKNGTNLGKPLKSLLVRGLDAKLQLGCCTWSKNWVVEWTWFLNRAVFNWAKGRIYSLTFCSWTSTKANQFTFQHQVNFWPRAAAKRGNFRGKKQRSLDVHDVRNQAQLCPVTPSHLQLDISVIYGEMLQKCNFPQTNQVRQRSGWEPIASVMTVT